MMSVQTGGLPAVKIGAGILLKTRNQTQIISRSGKFADAKNCLLQNTDASAMFIKNISLTPLGIINEAEKFGMVRICNIDKENLNSITNEVKRTAAKIKRVHII